MIIVFINVLCYQRNTKANLKYACVYFMGFKDSAYTNVW